MRHHLLLAAALLAAFAAGCSKPCQELADKVCQCSPTGTSEDTCKRQVDNIISDVDPTKREESDCSDLLDSCDSGGADFCQWLDTAEGKVACGLAY